MPHCLFALGFLFFSCLDLNYLFLFGSPSINYLVIEFGELGLTVMGYSHMGISLTMTNVGHVTRLLNEIIINQ